MRGLALAGLALVAVLGVAARSIDLRGEEGGETGRRGLLAGEQLRLLPGNRYRLEAWSRLGRGAALEQGTWTRLGDTVSLVPAAPGTPAYLMTQTVAGEHRSLSRAGEAAFERVD